MTARLRNFFTGAGLPVFLLTAMVVYEGFLLAIVFAPGSAGVWSGFAIEFKQWCFRYDPRTGMLRLGLEGNGSAGLRVTSRAQMAQRADFDFSPSVPLILEANLGSSDATLDLGGMTILSLTVRGGASRSTVTFATPTKGDCTRADFALGAAELDVTGLANAGCAEIRVDGGVGKAELSFDGTWRRDLKAEVSLAMGGLTLHIPRGTGVRLVTSRFLASLDAEGFTRTGDTWTTPGFDQAKRKLTVTVNASAAGVTVAWLPN